MHPANVFFCLDSIRTKWNEIRLTHLLPCDFCHIWNDWLDHHHFHVEHPFQHLRFTSIVFSDLCVADWIGIYRFRIWRGVLQIRPQSCRDHFKNGATNPANRQLKKIQMSTLLGRH